MKPHSEKIWFFVVLSLVTCTIAKGQSPIREWTFGVGAGDAGPLGKSDSSLPSDKLGTGPGWFASHAKVSSELPIGSRQLFGTMSETQPLSDLSGAFDKNQGILPKLAHGSSNSDINDESPEARASAKKSIISSDKRSAAKSSVSFWAVQGLVFASVVVAVETTHKCINAGSCTLIPTPFQSRAAMYSVGIPVAAGISVLSYELKNRGNHWWYLPPSIIVGADALLSIHSARASL